jgi:hypothetical protein
MKIEEMVENTDFSKHAYNKKDLFDLKELNLAIKQLNKRSSNGEDKIHNKMLQNTCQEFRKIILNLINETVKQAKIPKEWKNSVISMIPKKNKNSSNPIEYRPISMTSCIAKLAERLILSKMREFMDKKTSLLNNSQDFVNRDKQEIIYSI